MARFIYLSLCFFPTIFDTCSRVLQGSNQGIVEIIAHSQNLEQEYIESIGNTKLLKIIVI